VHPTALFTMDRAERSHDGARGYLRRAATVVGFSLVVALALGIARGGGWLQQLVYAEAIGLCIWACIDFGRLLFRLDADSHWPVGWRAAVLLLGGVIFGYVAGTWIGDLYCGCSTFELWRSSARSFASYLIFSIAISAAISYFFLSRSKDQRRLRQIATAQRDAADAQLKLLESQLEPHMLFNTLANLRVLIGTDPARAQTMLDHLNAFLRATLSGSRAAWHPLGAEFARVADYLQLMQVRMGERLQMRLDLPAALAALPVPPLLLQPLVENAIKHGLEPHVAGGRIEVSAERVGDALILRVRDDGAGLGAGDGNGAQFGLDQVRRRLATIYGATATFELAGAGAGGGACATIRLPFSAPVPTLPAHAAP
jgi:LytS/YehU family sensor histidine kinase